MINRYLDKIFATLLLIVALGGCTNADSDLSRGDGDGVVSLALDVTQSRTISTEDRDKLLENSTLKIYSVIGDKETLIRYYKPATEIPEEIYVISGDYKVTLSVGTNAPASFKAEDRCFYGESDFTVTAKEVSNVEVTASLTSRLVGVSFDDTIKSLFDDGYCLYVSTSDSFSKEDVENKTVPFVKFDSSTKSLAYFNLPDGVNNLSWGFYGMHTVRGEEVTLTGVIESPAEGSQSNLLFKYSDYLEVKTVTVSVDPNGEEHDDSFAFAPQPLIKGDGFSINEIQKYDATALGFDVKSINDLKAITVSVGENTYIPFIEGEVQDLANQGVIYTVGSDSKMGYLTLTPDFFEKFEYGGEQRIEIAVVDSVGATGTGRLDIMITGFSPMWISSDLWSCIGAVELYVADTSLTTSDMTVEYRNITSDINSEWGAVTSVTKDERLGFFNITIAPSWSESKNSKNLLIYRANGGVSPANTYEFRVKNSAGEGVTVAHFTAPETTQAIPYGDMENSGLSCWGNSNSGSTDWSSGNNSYSDGLCQQGTRDGMGGSHCAYLEATEVNAIIMKTLAAGNITFGRFEMAGTSGAVTFGQPFTWEARPRSFNLKYSASLGTVNYTKYGSFLANGSADMGRIYLAIVNWSERHEVSSGTSSPSGVWNPSEQNKVDGSGAIVGFAMYDVKQSTPEKMQQLEIPIYYYDKETKPDGKYTLVISAATCAYGDYMNGSTSSKMWIDDLEFGY